jgi:hypothetical protein
MSWSGNCHQISEKEHGSSAPRIPPGEIETEQKSDDRHYRNDSDHPRRHVVGPEYLCLSVAKNTQNLEFDRERSEYDRDHEPIVIFASRIPVADNSWISKSGVRRRGYRRSAERGRSGSSTIHATCRLRRMFVSTNGVSLADLSHLQRRVFRRRIAPVPSTRPVVVDGLDNTERCCMRSDLRVLYPVARVYSDPRIQVHLGRAPERNHRRATRCCHWGTDGGPVGDRRAIDHGLRHIKARCRRSDFWSDTVYDPVHCARSDRRLSVLSHRRIDRRSCRCRDWCSRRCAQGTAQISVVLGDSNGNEASTLSRAVVYWSLACGRLVPETRRRRSSEHWVRHSSEASPIPSDSAVGEGESVDDGCGLPQR